MLTKEQVLEKINLVKSKRKEDYIQNVLTKIENRINEQKIFSYPNTMKFINEQFSTKMGGTEGQISRALQFLKNELKAQHIKEHNKGIKYED